MYRTSSADWFKGRRSPAALCLLGLLSAAALTVSLLRLPPAIDAARGDGARGVFVAQALSCSKSCQWTGTFTSARQIVRGVVYEDSLPPSTYAGSTVPALYPGGYGLKAVFAVRGSTAWIAYAVLLLAGAPGLWASLWLGPIRYLRRRHYETLASRSRRGMAWLDRLQVKSALAWENRTC